MRTEIRRTSMKDTPGGHCCVAKIQQTSRKNRGIHQAIEAAASQ
jgi:hypothetical protein